VYVKLMKNKIIINLRECIKKIVKVNIIDYFLINKRKRLMN
jgi:hypothetical protein